MRGGGPTLHSSCTPAPHIPPYTGCLLTACCRRSPAKELQQHATEAAGLDMYGRALVASAWLGPRLLVREPSPAAAPAQRTGQASQTASLLHGLILVTGGMGALGTVVAQWLAGLGGCELWLLGRTGRTGGWVEVGRLRVRWSASARSCTRHACMQHTLSSPPSLPSPFYAGGDPLPAALHLSGCTVTCSKGDTAAAEEAAAVLAPAGTACTAPLRGIMHAGAVLDSKVIANILAASIRAEFAGRQLETPTPSLCILP